jgi:hypothetical protein
MVGARVEQALPSGLGLHLQILGGVRLLPLPTGNLLPQQLHALERDVRLHQRLGQDVLLPSHQLELVE